MLAFLCVQDYAQGFDLQPDSLKRGLVAARRAVETAPSNHLVHLGLAQALFFHREFQGFRNGAELAAALNPMDGNSIAFLGELLTHLGDSERGLTLATRAKQLSPHHPGWYWYADFFIENHVIQVVRRNTGMLQAVLDRQFGESMVMLDATKTLFFCLQRPAYCRATKQLQNRGKKKKVLRYTLILSPGRIQGVGFFCHWFPIGFMCFCFDCERIAGQAYENSERH